METFLDVKMACASKECSAEMEWQIVMISLMSGFLFEHRLSRGVFFKNVLHDITTWQHSFFKHPCYKTDFLFAIRLGPHGYARYTLLDTNSVQV